MAQVFLEATSAPITEAVTDPQMGNKLTPAWEQWFNRLAVDVQRMPVLLNVVDLSTQGASIGATDFSNSTILEGMYRISFHARVSRAATTSSSLTVTFSWTEGGVAQTLAYAAITGNTTTSKQSDVIVIRADAGTAINYATTYASVGATSMQYSLDLALEWIRPRGTW